VTLALAIAAVLFIGVLQASAGPAPTRLHRRASFPCPQSDGREEGVEAVVAGRVGPPVRDVHESGLDQREAIKQLADLRGSRSISIRHEVQDRHEQDAHRTPKSSASRTCGSIKIAAGSRRSPAT
jgi:hypothetical protein